MNYTIPKVGERYDVTTKTTFTGVFEGWTEDGTGEKLAIFATDSASGNPKRASGRRIIAEGCAEVELSCPPAPAPGSASHNVD